MVTFWGNYEGISQYTAANRHTYPASSERYQLTDIDGEDAFIRIGSIAMVRVLLDAMKPVEEDDEYDTKTEVCGHGFRVSVNGAPY